jgi:imidazolonepropionase-like amidohydrolase
LAGAHLDMAAAVRNAVSLARLPLADALRAASLTPARFLGLEHERGALIAGARADLVALGQDVQVIATWIGGLRNSATADSLGGRVVQAGLAMLQPRLLVGFGQHVQILWLGFTIVDPLAQ